MFVDLMSDVQTTLADRLFKAQMMVPQPMRAPQVTRVSGPTLDTTDEGYAPGAAAVAARQGFAPTGVAASAEADVITGAPVSTGAAVASGTARAERGSPLLTNRGEQAPTKPVTAGERVGRNDPCPCGSGLKYKKCHGRPGAPPL
ncbi:MAG: SEC-C domain-containing protein [Gemmatimonadota bacterium]|nr:MAG: SEC-C domain-containing protein [Gemmatimonadota bacterium]